MFVERYLDEVWRVVKWFRYTVASNYFFFVSFFLNFASDCTTFAAAIHSNFGQFFQIPVTLGTAKVPPICWLICLFHKAEFSRTCLECSPRENWDGPQKMIQNATCFFVCKWYCLFKGKIFRARLNFQLVVLQKVKEYSNVRNIQTPTPSFLGLTSIVPPLNVVHLWEKKCYYKISMVSNSPVGCKDHLDHCKLWGGMLLRVFWWNGNGSSTFVLGSRGFLGSFPGIAGHELNLPKEIPDKIWILGVKKCLTVWLVGRSNLGAQTAKCDGDPCRATRGSDI